MRPFHFLSWAAICGVLVVSLASLSEGNTRYVPDNYPSIQAALSASISGDSVLVRPGTYFENIKMRSKDVVLKSTSGPGVTVIDGSQPAHPDSASVIHLFGVGGGGKVQGFTIRGGHGSLSLGALFGRRGGGIFIEGGGGLGPVIEENWVLNNSVEGSQLPREGGGICIYGAARILRNRIGFNSIIGDGGGIYFYPGGTPNRIAIENEIYGNVAIRQVSNGEGGGAYIGREIQFSRNVIAFNQGDRYGGGLRIAAGTPFESTTIEGNTIAGNVSQEGAGGVWMIGSSAFPSVTFFANLIAYNLHGGVECRDNGGAEFQFDCNDVVGNDPDLMGECGIVLDEGTNFRADPLFGRVGIPYTPGDLCVEPNSPVLPGNSPPGCGLIGARGECSLIGIQDAQEVVRAFHAGAPYPNPFAGSTRIPFTVDELMPVEVTIYTIAGRSVRHLDGGSFSRGSHDLEWDGRNADGDMVPPGVYVAKIRAGNRETARVVVRTP